jgi:hypothetical protein
MASRARGSTMSSDTPAPVDALGRFLAEVTADQVTRDIDSAGRAVRLGKRTRPVPLDPASWAVLKRCLDHREKLRTANPHVMVTRGTKAGIAPASTAYASHLLDLCGVPPRTLRCTRQASLVNATDPKLVAAALGMNPEGVMIYLADHVDAGRMPEPGRGRPLPALATTPAGAATQT